MSIKTILFSSDEIWPLLNILNEICHGFYIYEFENIIGSKKEIALSLMSKLEQKISNEEMLISLDPLELMILKRSFEEVVKQIQEWEFQTRIGITISEANQIISKIR